MGTRALVWGQGPQIEVTGPGMGTRVLCGGQGTQDGDKGWGHRVQVGGHKMGTWVLRLGGVKGPKMGTRDGDKSLGLGTRTPD